MNSFLQWLTAWHIGDFAGILGLLVSVAGFAITIWQIKQAKTVTEQVRSSVQQVKKQVQLRTVIDDLNHIIQDLEDLKELHRLQVRSLLPGRYTEIRRRLIEINGRSSKIRAKEKLVLQESIGQFAELERIIGYGTQASIDAAYLNGIVNDEITKLSELHALLQNKERS